MPVIRDKDGYIIQFSQNLRGIRRYVSKNLVHLVAIDQLLAGEGKLCLLFDNGSSYETTFNSYRVMTRLVSRWKNLHGAPLLVNGQEQGVVGKDNPS